MTEHRDKDGKPCTRHAPASDGLLAWAAVGSRISGFHHDTASKLQSLMMALDEATEMVGDGTPDLRVALDTATTALRELHGLLTENRALAKAPQRKATLVPDLFKRAAARNAVKLTGDLGTASVHVAPASIIHALSLLLDMAAGSVQSTRAVQITVSTRDASVQAEITGVTVDPTKPMVNESIAVAAFLLAREDGALRCSEQGFVVQLPTRAPSAPVKP